MEKMGPVRPGSKVCAASCRRAFAWDARTVIAFLRAWLGGFGLGLARVDPRPALMVTPAV